MSGGSYNYLSTRVRPLDGQFNDLVAMSERLTGLGPDEPAAIDTRRVVELIVEANALADGLADVWHGIEWWDSGDWGEDQAQEEIQAYSQRKKN